MAVAKNKKIVVAGDMPKTLYTDLDMNLIKK